MKKGIVFAIVIAMLGWAIYDFSTSHPAEKRSLLSESHSAEEGNFREIGLEKGKIAPDFELTTIEGETVRLSDYHGERILLNFWATWCPPCRAEIPDMQKLYDEEDVVVLAVNMTTSETSVAAVSEFVSEFHMTFPVLLDDKGTVMNAYHIQVYPTTYMIDSNGVIQFISLGAMNHSQMLQLLEGME